MSTDTGEIARRIPFPEMGALPLDVGEHTRNLGMYVAGAQLARRPDATGDIPRLMPDPATGFLSDPVAPSERVMREHETVTNLIRPALYTRRVPGGRHRKPTFWDGVWARIRGAM